MPQSRKNTVLEKQAFVGVFAITVRGLMLFYHLKSREERAGTVFHLFMLRSRVWEEGWMGDGVEIFISLMAKNGGGVFRRLYSDTLTITLRWKIALVREKQRYTCICTS
jgi:hypothetical protein